MRKIYLVLLIISFPVYAMQHGDERKKHGDIEVYHLHSNRWLTVDDFFSAEIKRLNGPTYGTIRNNQYPDYATVKEWDTLIDVLSDGSRCPMVFFHSRWRRLPDVLALSEELRNWDGCARVFD